MAAQGFLAPKVFISYRREDSRDVAGRIRDNLAVHFGPDAVFMDVTGSIPPGTDFRTVVTEAVQRCEVVLVVIGQNWLRAQDKAGRRRLDQPGDLVCLEVEVALKGPKVVIPVLVQNTEIPAGDDLPPSIQALAFRNGHKVRSDGDFDGDMDRLIRSLEKAMAQPANKPENGQTTPGKVSEATPQTKAASKPPGVRITSHSQLYYWWPVWVAAIVACSTTAISGESMAILPSGAHVKPIGEQGFHLTLPDGQKATDSLQGAVTRSKVGKAASPEFTIAENGIHGMLFVSVLLFVIIVPNLANDESGWWLFAFVIAGLFALLLFSTSFIRVQINCVGYMVIGLTVLFAWAINLLIDREVSTLITITPTQLRVCEDRAGELTVDIDPTKLRFELGSSFPCQWLLGFGSGMIVIHTGDARSRVFVFRNVWSLGQKWKLIEKMWLSAHEKPAPTS